MHFVAQDSVVDQFIGDEMVEGGRMWVDYMSANYKSFNHKLMPLDLEKESHRELLKWEEEEEARFIKLKEDMDSALGECESNDMICDIDYGRVERRLQSILTDDDGLFKMTLPDLPWNGGRQFNIEKKVLGMAGEIMMAARNAGMRGVFTMVTNRNSLLVKEDAEYSQRCLNGDPNIAASWLHNFVLTFTMDFQRTKSQIVVSTILDQGSKMPDWDEKLNDWDWRPDRKHCKAVIMYSRCEIVCVHCGQMLGLFAVCRRIIEQLIEMFPGLFSVTKAKNTKTKRVKILMLPQFLRPDIGTHDCLRRSDKMERNVRPSFFYVRTFEQLVDWAWVCAENDAVKRRTLVCVSTAPKLSRKQSEEIRVENSSNTIRE